MALFALEFFVASDWFAPPPPLSLSLSLVFFAHEHWLKIKTQKRNFRCSDNGREDHNEISECYEARGTKLSFDPIAASASRGLVYFLRHKKNPLDGALVDDNFESSSSSLSTCVLRALPFSRANSPHRSNHFRVRSARSINRARGGGGKSEKTGASFRRGFHWEFTRGQSNEWILFNFLSYLQIRNIFFNFILRIITNCRYA